MGGKISNAPAFAWCGAVPALVDELQTGMGFGNDNREHFEGTQCDRSKSVAQSWTATCVMQSIIAATVASRFTGG